VPVGKGTIAVAAAPVLSGTAKVGSTLTVSAGRYSASAVTLSYQWLRDAQAIRGEHYTRHVVTSADRGHRLAVQVTVSAPGWTTLRTTTPATSRVR
jgi:hypothetical protein